MGMGSFINGLIQEKGKSLFNDFVEKADLDRDGRLDKDQVSDWFARLGTVVQRVDDAIDQEKLIAVAKDATGVLHEILTYLDNLKKNV